MAQVRVFQDNGGTLSEIPEGQLRSIRWVDNLTAQPEATVQVSPAAAYTPANAPDRLIIVPSAREDVLVPAYGPYEVTSYAWDGVGYTLQGVIGVDFAARFATDDGAALDAIIAQVEGFSNGNYEPFLSWATAPLVGDGPNVAKLGLDFITNLVRSSLFNVSTLSDLEGLLAGFGLTAYMLTVWPAVGVNATQRLAIWPRHPLVLGESYSISPGIGEVRSWSGNVPAFFATPRRDMPARAEITEHANMEQFPSVRVPDQFNSPVGSSKPNFRTRRIDVGYRLLGVEQEIALFYTGSLPPVLHRNPQVTGLSGTAKLGEEIQRWDMQNSAAEVNLKRFPGDDWGSIPAEFFVPLQIVEMPEAIFPAGWPETQRDFVVREVTHEYSAGQGYSQTISGTLWQGPFERLTAVDIAAEDD